MHVIPNSVRCKKGSPQDPCDLVRNGTKKRKPKGPGGEKIPHVPVQRYYCKKHQRYASLTPQSLLPNYHYEAKVVNRVVEHRLYGNDPEAVAGHLPSRKTARRWLHRLVSSAEGVKKTTLCVLGQAGEYLLYGLRNLGVAYLWRLRSLWVVLELLASEACENRSPYFYCTIRSP